MVIICPAEPVLPIRAPVTIGCLARQVRLAVCVCPAVVICIKWSVVKTVIVFNPAVVFMLAADIIKSTVARVKYVKSVPMGTGIGSWVVNRAEIVAELTVAAAVTAPEYGIFSAFTFNREKSYFMPFGESTCNLF